MVKSRISSKGQITLPKSIRNALRLSPGEEVVFELRGDEVILKPRRGVPLSLLFGRLGGRAYPGEEEEARAKEVAWARGER
ncbi:AbrB/MazE/SpoVT family DNA-binding domain-containing protein [Meiothermus sp.]|jgi:AbrB family looped-hinge helix DNA binding protein|uniref:AbrB/MazE/SpoVT family DNA-binding domain-containing protein n=1 Tax=Meiothermus sp. TaxID=1955249 RepID=UPI0021DECEAC|nr:AbrB/MazE/SpoVT family DNA-binding domain-containing protein [Meiothermus sp.]GIW25686.1 MAG: AbrB family transcriptional regulator [Meiothermus sp.]